MLRLHSPGGNVTSDVRAHYMRTFRSLPVTATMNLLYPRLLAIHDLAEDVGFPAANGRLKLPRFMRASYAYMVADGAYLLCTSYLLIEAGDADEGNSQWRDRDSLAGRRRQPANSGRSLRYRQCPGT